MPGDKEEAATTSPPPTYQESMAMEGPKGQDKPDKRPETYIKGGGGEVVINITGNGGNINIHLPPKRETAKQQGAPEPQKAATPKARPKAKSPRTVINVDEEE